MPELTAEQLREISKNLREIADAFCKLAEAFAVTTVSIEDQTDLDRWETEGRSYDEPEDRDEDEQCFHILVSNAPVRLLASVSMRNPIPTIPRNERDPARAYARGRVFFICLNLANVVRTSR